MRSWWKQNKRREKKSSDKSRLAAFPTAVQRVKYASSLKSPCVPSSRDPSTIFLVDEAYARGLLEGEPHAVVKPPKGNLLVEHALTNANGDNWQRQRRLVQYAFSGPLSRAARKNAIEASRAQVRIKIAEQCQKSSTYTLDARELSLEVAAIVLSTAVFGQSHASRMAPLILSLFFDNLKARGKDGQPEKAYAQISSLVHKICEENDSENPPNNLIAALHSGRDGDCLERPEIVGNANSALLAGTQALATTLTGCLAHLAGCCSEHLAPSNTNAARQVVRETLRILPPIANLPRNLCCKSGPEADQSWIISDDNDQTRPSLQWRTDTTVVLDTLTMCHANASAGSSWQFDPCDTMEDSSKKKFLAFGMGQRQCPAGSLAVDCVVVFLEELARNGILWEFADRTLHAGSTGVGGWVQHVVYAPTLTYPRPIHLRFSTS